MTLIVLHWNSKSKKTFHDMNSNNSNTKNDCNHDLSLDLVPPLPPVVQNLLSNAHLAYLSTSDAILETSHLSLMRFTYLPEEELIVMSTRRDTKKFDLLKCQRGVAMLVHDFGSSNLGNDNEVQGTYSITLNGDCFIVEDNMDAERYRQRHLEHNPDYPQFIVGDSIAILCVRVTSARICNINDQVQRWDIKSGIVTE